MYYICSNKSKSYRRTMNNIYWTTKTGVVINVDDMDDNHVRNAFKMLLRKTQSRPAFELNGDIANMMINDAIDHELWDEHKEVYTCNK